MWQKIFIAVIGLLIDIVILWVFLDVQRVGNSRNHFISHSICNNTRSARTHTRTLPLYALHMYHNELLSQYFVVNMSLSIFWEEIMSELEIIPHVHERCSIEQKTIELHHLYFVISSSRIINVITSDSMLYYLIWVSWCLSSRRSLCCCYFDLNFMSR